MNIVLIHIGSDIPDYMLDCILQIRKFYQGVVMAVVPKSSHSKIEALNCGVAVIDVQTYMDKPIYKEFIKVCFLDGFWNVTLGRLFVLQAVMEDMGLENVVHIENDVLLYNNPETFQPLFNKILLSGILICPVGPRYASAAVLYAPNHVCLKNVISLFGSYFIVGRKFIEQKINGSDVTEMTMLAHFQTINGCRIKYFPILPSSDAVQYNNSIWDGASLGQFVGGTNADGPGWYGAHHHFGAIQPVRKYTVEWKVVDGKKVPYLNDRGRLWRVNNLHIHCKDLKKYSS